MARQRLEPEQARTMILDAAERLMRREGYAAVNTRSVAAEAGLKAPLVHYHFATTDNLLLAFYRRSSGRTEERIAAAIASSDPLRALWHLNTDPDRTALAAEFMALANHRESIRTEMAANVTRFRALQTEALRVVLPPESPLSPDVMAVVLAAIGRAFVMEGGIGVTAGHEPTQAYITGLIGGLARGPAV